MLSSELENVTSSLSQLGCWAFTSTVSMTGNQWRQNQRASIKWGDGRVPIEVLLRPQTNLEKNTESSVSLSEAVLSSIPLRKESGSLGATSGVLGMGLSISTSSSSA